MNRTDRVLHIPDRSRATYTRAHFQLTCYGESLIQKHHPKVRMKIGVRLSGRIRKSLRPARARIDFAGQSLCRSVAQTEGYAALAVQ